MEVMQEEAAFVTAVWESLDRDDPGGRNTA
jgi:hypothetical protein